MCRFLETIRIQNGMISNLEFHNRRLNITRKHFFDSADGIDLKSVICVPDPMTSGVVKCRVIYQEKIKSVEFSHYQKKIINSLRIVYNNDIDYAFKYADRSAIDAMMKDIKTDDIIIIKNGFITDASYANLVFFDGTKWFTPGTPLLNGTRRAQWLGDGLIEETDIKISDLKTFLSVKLINAMLEWNELPAIPLEKIYNF